MRKLEKNEFTSLCTLDEALKNDGFYAIVNKEYKVQSMSIFLVRNGKLYEDISLDCGYGAWSEDDLCELLDDCKQYDKKFAKLVRDYTSYFNIYYNSTY